MSVCAECGDFELFFVPACGDDDVGSSKVLLFAGEDLAKVQSEYLTMDTAFKALDDACQSENPEKVVEAQDHLTKLLESYIKPNSFLPEKHLVHAYSIIGKRWVRIRSDKMRNHWRSYNIEKSLLKSIKTGNQKQLPRGPLIKAFKKIRNDIAKEVTGGFKVRGVLLKKSISGTLIKDWDENWEKWIEAVNESLTYSTGNQNFDLSAGAQLLRGYAGFAVNLGYDPLKKTTGLSGNAEARAILAEGKTAISGYFPHRDGWHFLLQHTSTKASTAGQQQELNFGYFRANFTFSVQAMLGASIYGSAGVEYTPLESGELLVKPAIAGLKGEVAAGAFAGVEAGGSVTGALEWKSPGMQIDGGPVQKADWGAFFSVGVLAAGNLGAGLEGQFKLDFKNGKFLLHAQAQLVIGLGAKGSITATVDFTKIVEFVIYVYHQLKDNDFDYLDFISATAFNMTVNATMYIIEKGEAAFKALDSLTGDIVEGITQLFSNPADAEEYAKRIKARPTILIHAPPEAKGMILYKLSETYTFSFEEHQEAAILTVIGTVQTRREWSQIVERITPTGEKTSAAEGMARLNKIMDGGSQIKMDNLLLRIMSTIEVLPATTRYAGMPVQVRNLA